jgi:alpha-tubulin suppressor-like RCC1 family protein
MKLKSLFMLGGLLLLAGCGTLRMEVDTPVTGPTATKLVLPTFPPTFTITPTVTLTPTATSIPTETSTPSPTPLPSVDVPVAAGDSHTCVVTAARGVKCWGNNEHGQLGDGTTTGSNVPVDVSGLEGVTALTAGWSHTCALTSAGAVWCWGYNKYGELGGGGIEDSSVPVAVNGLEGVAFIEAGDDHTCAVTNSGAVMCWGYNEYGQLGDGTEISRAQPVAVGGLEAGIRSVAAGWGHTCALTASGGVKCWGNNEYGQLGYGDVNATFRPTPVDVTGLGSGVKGITADGGSTCGLMESGGLQCWGNDKYGQLGNDAAVNRFEPVDVIGLEKGTDWAVMGWNHACALDGDELKCWGWNLYGQLGDGTKGTRLKPKAVKNLPDGAAAVALGRAHTCAATNSGRVACWGSNAEGQLGDGTTNDSVQPRYIPGLITGVNATAPPISDTPTPAATAPITRTISPITAGGTHTCMRTSAGGVKCWGDNKNGQLGDGSRTPRNSPVDVTGLTKGVEAVEAGLSHTCALTNRGGVKCWGNNDYGQLGDGTTEEHLTPVDVTGLTSGVVALAAGAAHTCALTAQGGVKCWGWNQSGQLGDGTTEERLTPVDVTGLESGVVALTAGAEHNCVLTAAGGVACWGSHSSGRGAYPSSPDAPIPVAVEGLSSGVTRLISGAFYNCVLTAAGVVECWGSNTFGQFGNGTAGGTVNPVEITGLPDSTVPWAGSWGHTCGVSASGTAYCWGLNDRGQLGDGSRTQRLYPSEVGGLAGVVAFALGYGHSCALTAANELWCWGINSQGELGDGTNVASLTPVKVVGL